MQRREPRPAKHDDRVKIDSTREEVARSLFSGLLSPASSGATSKMPDSRIPDSFRLGQKPWEGRQR